MSSSVISITDEEFDPWALAPEVDADFVYEYHEEFPDDLTEYPETEPW